MASGDPLESLSSINMPENQQSDNENGLFLNQLDCALVEMEPEYTGFWNENISQNKSNFLPHNLPQTCDSVRAPNCLLMGKGFYMEMSSHRTCNNRTERPEADRVQSLKLSHEGKKTKKASRGASQSTASQNVDDNRVANELAQNQEEENLESEQKSAARSCSTIVVEERMCKSTSEAAQSAISLAKFSSEAPRKDHNPMRAKRGQAISRHRHSLAERIRRERISERMKFLQGLVPGCDKITGKAVMLEEIINYILSLQRQVEVVFVDEKLAAVDHPGGKYQPDQYLPNNVDHPQGVNDHEISSFHSLPDNSPILETESRERQS